MNRLNEIFNKIAKMEQNAQEVKLGMNVELALVDDVQTLYNSANKIYQSNTDTLKKYATQLESMFQKSADEYKKAMDKYTQLEKMSKELGLQLPNDVIKLKSLIEFGINDSLQSKKNAVNILSI